jgi:hypothetical protein
LPTKPGERKKLQLPQLLVDQSMMHGALLFYLLAHHAKHEADGAHGRAMC